MSLGDFFNTLLRSAKDAGASFLVERYVAQRLQPYGRMINLTIDSKNKSIRLECLLQGETEPVIVTIEAYDLVERAGGLAIRIQRAGASRPWMHALLQDFAIGREIPLPDQYAHLAKSLLQA